MAAISWGRRELLITMSAGAAAGIIGAGARDAAAQQVKPTFSGFPACWT